MLLEGGDVRTALNIEFDGGHGIEAPQRIADGSLEYLPDGRVVLKLDFCLRGMYVHIDVLGRHIKIEEIGHLLALGDEMGVGFHHRLVEIGMSHEAPVDEEELMGSLLASRLGLAHEARDTGQRCVHLDREQLLAQFLFEHADDALSQAGGWQAGDERAVVRKAEGDGGIHEHDTLEVLHDVAQLRLVGLQEFTACRDIIEKIAHLDVRPHRAGTGLLAHHTRPFDGEVGAQVVVGGTSAQLHLCHSSD